MVGRGREQFQPYDLSPRLVPRAHERTTAFHRSDVLLAVGNETGIGRRISKMVRAGLLTTASCRNTNLGRMPSLQVGRYTTIATSYRLRNERRVNVIPKLAGLARGASNRAKSRMA